MARIQNTAPGLDLLLHLETVLLLLAGVAMRLDPRGPALPVRAPECSDGPTWPPSALRRGGHHLLATNKVFSAQYLSGCCRWLPPRPQNSHRENATLSTSWCSRSRTTWSRSSHRPSPCSRPATCSCWDCSAGGWCTTSRPVQPRGLRGRAGGERAHVVDAPPVGGNWPQ